MGDKGGKKDKNKTQKQKVTKQEQQAQKKQEKKQKSTPCDFVKPKRAHLIIENGPTWGIKGSAVIIENEPI